jgi:hypothetical protein
MESAPPWRSLVDPSSWSCALLVACALGCDGGSHTIGRFDGAASIGPADGGGDASGDEGGDGEDGDGDGAGPELDEPPPASCSGSEFKCVAIAPTGWTGPFALFDGAPMSAPECGGCMPTTVVEAFADPEPFAEQCDWTRAAVGCTADLGEVPGCAASETCMPAFTAPFEQGTCILQYGDLACPRAPYQHKRLFDLSLEIESPYDAGCNANDAEDAGSIAPVEPVTVCCTAGIEPDPIG